jgi:2-iminobutanoate/2-iminopropanoate deaminase
MPRFLESPIMASRRQFSFGIGAVLCAAPFVLLRTPVSAQTRIFRDRDLHGQDYSTQDLSNKDFSRSNLVEADLSYANCSNSIFKEVNFQKAVLIGARFIGSDLTGADLRDAKLEGTNFRDAKLVKANLEANTLYLAQSEGFYDKKKERELSFSQKDAVQSSGGTDSDNGSLQMQGANLRNAAILGNIARVNFRGADLRGANLLKTMGINDAVLRGAIYDADTHWRINPVDFGAVKAP